MAYYSSRNARLRENFVALTLFFHNTAKSSTVENGASRLSANITGFRATEWQVTVVRVGSTTASAAAPSRNGLLSR